MILNLITDRTSSDVAYAKSFQGKKWADLSAAQKEEYLAGLKGAYSYMDFNRVHNAVKYLSNLLIEHGYNNTITDIGTFTNTTLPNTNSIQTYLNNIAELKNKYYSNVTGTMPTTSTWLTMDGANYLEKVLVNIKELIKNMNQYYVYCGIANAGQNRMWQNRFRRGSNWNSLNYEISKYNQTWQTVTPQKSGVISLPVEEFDGISLTINSWNKAMSDLDELVGVVE